MASGPLVSVLMPVRDAAAYVRQAVESVLGQTLRDFELLIIDDGSTDQTLSIVRSITDPRIRLIGDSRLLGISVRLNEGLDAARGQFIARMDSDDICASTRLQRQASFLLHHEEVDLLGCSAVYINSEGGFLGVPREYPSSDFQIKFRLLTSNCLLHPTVMFRQRGTPFRYSEEFLFAQDYELWLRMSACKVYANLSDVLLMQRRHQGAVSSEKRRDQKYFATKALQRYALTSAGTSLSDPVAALLIDPADSQPDDASTLREAVHSLQHIGDVLLSHSATSDKSLKRFISCDISFFAARYLVKLIRRQGFRFGPAAVVSYGRLLLSAGSLLALASAVGRYFLSQVRLRRRGRLLACSGAVHSGRSVVARERDKSESIDQP